VEHCVEHLVTASLLTVQFWNQNLVEAETGVQALRTDKKLKPLNVLETLTNHVYMQVLVTVLIYS
jgi:hypothetical protein